MSLNNPDRRPWGTARGARITTMSAWAIVAVTALVTAFLWVQMLQRGETSSPAAIVFFNVSVFSGIGALFIDLWLAQRRGDPGDAAGLPRLPGAWFTGAGIGTVLAAVLGGGRDVVVPLLWGLLMLIVGAVVFFSPVMLERYRERRARRHAGVRAEGVHTKAVVTRVTVFYREHIRHQRVTMRFTDQNGDQRWFTQTAAAGSSTIEEGQSLSLHYDRANPSRKRSLVVDWPTY